MKKLLLFFSCFLLFQTLSSFGQYRPVDGKGELYTSYSLPSDEDGITLVGITARYKLTKYSGELVIAATASCTPNSRDFRYKGKLYNFSSQNRGEFDQIRISDPVITFSVKGPSFNEVITVTALAGGQTGILGSNSVSMGKVGNQTLDQFTVEIIRVESVRFTNMTPLISFLNEQERNKQKLERYEDYLRDASRKINSIGKDPKDILSEVDAIMRQANAVKPPTVPDDLSNLANWISKERGEIVKRIKQEDAEAKEKAEKEKLEKEKAEKEKQEKEKAEKEKADKEKTEAEKEREQKEKEEQEKKEKEEAKKAVEVKKPLTPDEERWLQIARELEREARAMEKRGDDLAALGTMFLPDALNMYRASYKKYPLVSVQSKIQKLEQNEMAAKLFQAGVEEVGKAADKLFDELDPGRASFKGYAGVQYTSLYRLTGFDNKNGVSPPSYTGVVASFNFLVLTAQMRIGYMVTQPILTYIGEQGYYGGFTQVDSGYNQAKGLTFGYAVGVYAPIKRVIFQAIVGAEAMPKQKLYSQNFYRLDETTTIRSDRKSISEVGAFIGRKEIVLGYEIIKEKLAIAFTYTSFKIKEQKEYIGQKVKPYPAASQYSPNGYYKLLGFRDKVNTYSHLGLSLLLRFEM